MIDTEQELVASLKESSQVMMSAANRLAAAVGTLDSSNAAFMDFMERWIVRLEGVIECMTH